MRIGLCVPVAPGLRVWAACPGQLAPGKTSLPVLALLLALVAFGPIHSALPERNVGTISLPQVRSGT